MLRVFYHTDNEISKDEGMECFGQIPLEKIFWVDLQFPTDSERKKVESLFYIDFNELRTENEMESNFRFYEAENLLLITSNFITAKGDHYETIPVFFYLLDHVLISERDADLASFAEVVKKIKRNRKAFRNGSEVLEGILETKVDIDSDFIEQTAKEIDSVARSLSLKITDNHEQVLLKISEYQEATTLTRESFVDKQRIVSGLLKTNLFENKERLKILIKDINAMLEYSSFVFMRLEYLQNTVLGLINIEQNKAVKIFTIVAVIFMPPTLIASIYGMNFRLMPELDWSFGYPIALLLIVGSSLLTLFIFKTKKWL